MEEPYQLIIFFAKCRRRDPCMRCGIRHAGMKKPPSAAAAGGEAEAFAGLLEQAGAAIRGNDVQGE